MSDLDYPVTRLQAARCLRRGDSLKRSFKRDSTIEVSIKYVDCPKHINARLWSGIGTSWIVLDWKQLLGFIRRNYVRSYEDL